MGVIEVLLGCIYNHSIAVLGQLQSLTYCLFCCEDGRYVYLIPWLPEERLSYTLVCFVCLCVPLGPLMLQLKRALLDKGYECTSL